MLSQRFPKAITRAALFPQKYPKALMKASLSAVVRQCNWRADKPAPKQSLRTCNVDNELRQALVLLPCPPMLDWRTTINAESAHYPRGCRGEQTLRSVNSILTVPTRFFQNL